MSATSRSSVCKMQGCKEKDVGRNFNGLCTYHQGMFRRGKVNQCPRCFSYKESKYHACYDCRDLVPEGNRDWERGDQGVSEFYVYLLLLNNKTFYAGQTRDLQRRLEEHKAGTTAGTKGKDPTLVWYNTVPTREQATALELQLKTGHPSI